MRLLFALTDTRVLLAAGIAGVILLGLYTVWTLTIGADLARTQAELEALPPELRYQAEMDRVGRMIEELGGAEGYADPQAGPSEADFEAQIQAMEREAMLGRPARASSAGDVPLRNPRHIPVLSTAGVVGVSILVGCVILFAGAGISLMFLRTASAPDPSPESPSASRPDPGSTSAG